MNDTRDKTLLLFNYDWDASGYARHGERHQFTHAGFDLFSFPSNAHLAWFDMDRFVGKWAAKAKKLGLTAVSSQHEQFGALAAALLAEKMGWPGTPPAAVVACQHKLYAREVLQRVAPEANVAFARLDCAYGAAVPKELPAGLQYPAFVKPVKAAFSVLARTVAQRAQLHAHTRFGAFELWVIRHLVEPFERVAKRLLPHAGTAHSLMVEATAWSAQRPLPQYSLDGIAFGGSIKPLGIVDSIMYPGTQAFMRFDYPSQLPQAAQAQALDVAQRFLSDIGYTNGFFNMEFFYDEAAGQLKVIEFNPRMASQFADLYQRVDGRDLYAMALALAHGQDPWALAVAENTAGAASSFVYRAFDQAAIAHHAPQMPSAAALALLTREFPDHLLLQFPKDSTSLSRDFKWLGSYRYGILHLGGADADDLRQRCIAASGILGWPAPYGSPVRIPVAPKPLAELAETYSAPASPTSIPSLATNPTIQPWRLSA
jgi:hypothetical protein